MRNNFASGTGVHARKPEVGADIGVVEVDDGSSAEVGNIFVINLGVGSGCGDDSGGDGGGSSEKGATIALGVECGLGHVLSARGERRGRAAKLEYNMGREGERENGGA